MTPLTGGASAYAAGSLQTRSSGHTSTPGSAGHPIAKGPIGEHHRRARVGEHPFDARPRVVRIERQIRATGLEGGEHRDHQVERAIEVQADERVGAHAHRLQPVRHPVGASIQLRERDGILAAHHREGIRRAPRLRLDELVNARGLMRRVGRVPFADHADALARREHGQPGQTGVEALDERAEKRLERGAEPPGRRRGHAPAVEQEHPGELPTRLLQTADRAGPAFPRGTSRRRPSRDRRRDPAAPRTSGLRPSASRWPARR